MADQKPLEAWQNFEPDLNESPADTMQPPTDTASGEHPLRIGSYRIERVLGKGGFGLVYLTYHEQPNRSVATNVPQFKLIFNPDDAEAYLVEARTLAHLHLPVIVPAHDVGITADCPCYVDSKYLTLDHG